MSGIYLELILMALGGLGLAVGLEMHRSRREERQWRSLRQRVAREIS